MSSSSNLSIPSFIPDEQDAVPNEEEMSKKTKQIEVIQVNLNKCKDAAIEVVRQSAELLMITEPYVYKQGKVTFYDSNGQWIYAKAGVKQPRACIRVHPSLEPWLVEEFSDRDIATVAIKVQKKLTYICSVYLDIKLPVKKPMWVSLIKRCNDENIPLIAGLDCNAHSPLWGCKESNNRGELMEDLIHELQLTVANNGSTWTFEAGEHKSIIDITLMNERALLELGLEEWRVDRRHNFSDHNYIKYSFGKFLPGTRWSRNFRRGDWEKFEKTTDDAIDQQQLMEVKDMNNSLEELYLILNNALNQAAPMKKAPKCRPHRWWNNELQHLKMELLKLGDKRRQSADKMEKYREARRLFVKERKKAKQQSWRDFC
ncbi:Hypothetical predicted protein, partial [Paramuricea clavata]